MLFALLLFINNYFIGYIITTIPLLILCTAVLSLFPLLVILNSSEFATRELNSWLLVKQILTADLGAKLLFLADEPLSFGALLEIL